MTNCLTLIYTVHSFILSCLKKARITRHPLQDSSFDSSSPSTPNLSEDHQMESSPKMTQRRMIRNEKARSSPPLSPSSFLRGQNQNDSFSSCSSINSSNSYNNDFKARNENSLVPLSPSSLLPGVEQLVESSNNNNNNNNQNNSNSNFSPSRSRSNSRGVLYSPRSRSPSITPTSSPSSSCKNIPPPSTPPIPIISNGSNRLDPISESLLTSDANVMSTPITQNLASLRLNGSSSIQITPATPITPISLSSRHVTINDFTLIEKIGEGGFGQVYLAKKQDTGEVVALKRMSKDLIWSKNKISHIKNERDILAQGKNHRYIVSLVYSFQDDQYLYLAMEYVAGGDLRSLLSAIGCLDEENAKFYMAEMVEAVDSCHTLGYCHRDLKPENFLIDKTGHIKLADFGLSKMFTRYVKSAKGTPGPNPAVLEHTPMKFSSNSLSTSVTDFSGFGSFKDISLQARLAYSVVGSPFYMAPEVLQATTGYGDEVDWWSLGCMFYEFICGVPPFDGDSPEEVMETVLKWKSNLQRPPNISDDLWSLITGLITDGNTRLGTGERGVENIKSHPFFSGVSWGMLHENEPPFVPLLEDDFDTTYFEKDRERAVVYTNRNSGGTVSTYKGKANRNILGFTYPRAGDDPLVWSNMLKGLTTEQNNENNINKLKTSLNHLTPPGASPSSNDTNQESTSPYSTYRNKFSLTEMNLELSNKEPWN
ncbi:putative protein serine/threonine kinase [Heterostelium album PN500]|uniref:non-specific serine/threonine protein kinase n=1 Tax=Heterostelium pallidum (strain ATCC 26659 / Pp 5 / PN500) TaxID=670386 RepID=D3BM81_HETP5|nr:putative protein serine/threonine kinase [Heterostelium album PN500]EFA77682.1 putative protein serine/threonine kinase [Heterostelium album PN500]|eukprot:XP_020429810.1 putative protein serine/threonine kinase [Heterostelium album PN500]